LLDTLISVFAVQHPSRYFAIWVLNNTGQSLRQTLIIITETKETVYIKEREMRFYCPVSKLQISFEGLTVPEEDSSRTFHP